MPGDYVRNTITETVTSHVGGDLQRANPAN